VIHDIERIVEQVCKQETNIFGYSIWTHHITQVVQNAKQLAKRLGADLEIVEIAALLHDYASVKDATLYKDHHLNSAIEAENILKRFDYPAEKINAVKHCIETHRGSVYEQRRSLETDCVASADAMAHIQNVPALLYSAYIQRGMEIDEGIKWLRRKLERSWNKMMPEAQEMVKEKYGAAMKILATPDNINP
jgi:predicted hydrolase (HD superfamily)